MGISLHLGSVGEHGKGIIYEGRCEMDEGGCKLWVSFLREPSEGNLEVGYFTGHREWYAN